MQRLLLPFLLLLSFSGCSMLNPDEKQINAYAAEAFEKIKSESKLSNDPEILAMVNRVARRITEESGEQENWEWIVIESPEANAWAMPGGKMAVYTGILPVVKNEAGLAAVLGHEVAHVTLDHGQERYARAVKGNVAGLAIGAATAIGGQLFCQSQTCQSLAGLGGAAAGFAITFFDRKFSRADETEADKKGLSYMAQAGYAPAEAIGVWERMAANAEGQPPEFLSTHPSPKTRQKNIKKWLPEANEVYSEAPRQHGNGVPIKAL